MILRPHPHGQSPHFPSLPVILDSCHPLPIHLSDFQGASKFIPVDSVGGFIVPVCICSACTLMYTVHLPVPLLRAAVMAAVPFVHNSDFPPLCASGVFTTPG